MVDLRVADRFGHADLIGRIAEAVFPQITRRFFADSGKTRGMSPGRAAPELSEHFLQSGFADRLLRFGCHHESTVGIVAQVAFPL